MKKLYLSVSRLFFICLLLFCRPVNAQETPSPDYAPEWKKIDSLALEGLPRQALGEVETLYGRARREGNPAILIKAVIRRMLFQGEVEEDVFEKVIGELREDLPASSWPATPVLHSLLAEAYWKFYQQNRYRIHNRSTVADTSKDFRNWDYKRLVTESDRHYRLSLADTARLRHTPVETLDGVLAGDSATRIFRPTLYDLLAHRALSFYRNGESSLDETREFFSFDREAFFGEAEVFAHSPLSSPDSVSRPYRALQLLQELTRFHLEDPSPEALTDLELQRLDYVYGQSRLPSKDSLYANALDNLMDRTARHEMYSTVAYTLADFYYQQKMPAVIRNRLNPGSDNEQDPLALIKAVKICEDAIERYPGSRGAVNAGALISRITQKDLKLTAEDVNIPGEPFRMLVTYTNVPEASLRIIRLEGREADSVRAFSGTGRREKLLETFLSKEPVQEQRVALPGAEDHYEHRVEIKADALPAGRYALLAYPGNTFHKDSADLVYTLVQVSGLSAFMRTGADGGMEFFVTDRKNGLPVEKAGVRIYTTVNRIGSREKDSLTHTFLTDQNGRGIFNPDGLDRYSYRVIHGKDTLVSRSDKWINRLPGKPEQGGDRKETRLVFFTDRGLYRPGQTVYFKGLLYEAGLKNSRVLVRRPVKVSFRDANGEEAGLSRFTTNEFGTFNGSFMIPREGLTGMMRLESEHGSTFFEVAEYKRPTFEVEFESPDPGQRGGLNDSVSLEGTARAFAGYPVGRAKIQYTVTRSKEPVWGYRSFYLPRSETRIASGETVTDAEGNFRITFFAEPDPADDPGTDPVYTYQINADVTDNGGETQSGTSSLRLARSNLIIHTGLDPVIHTPEMPGYTIGARNLDGDPVPATLQIGVYRLQAPDRPVKSRLWRQPDRFIMSRKEFKKYFPADVYDNESDPDTWTRAAGACMELNLQTDSVTALPLDELKTCKPGHYVMEMQAETASGENKKQTLHFQLSHGQPVVPQQTDEFIKVIKNSGKPGEFAEFHAGTGRKNTAVLYEILSGRRVLEQRWIRTGTVQEKIQVPIKVTGEGDLRVQFTIVHENRIYTRQQDIVAEEEDNGLDIRFRSFREKLRPGSAETWTLSVTPKGRDDQKATAEMVATLYDASLDDIAGFNWNQQPDARLRPFSFSFSWDTYGFIGQAGSSLLNPRIRRTASFPPKRSYIELETYWSNYAHTSYQSAYRQFLRELQETARLEAERKEREEAYRLQSAGIKDGIVIRGLVTDETGEPLPGVMVLIKGYKAGVTTGPDGRYQIKTPQKAILQFSFLGYKSHEVAIYAGRQQVDVVLESDEQAMDEVVVVGYGAQEKGQLTGANIRIRGTSAPEAEAAEADGDVAFASIGQPSRPTPEIRKDFRETAFFYPHLRTDENGEIRIEFTLPESLTRWKMMGFAHTPDLRHGRIIRELIAQKPLSVTAYTPRFLREGDRVRVTARVVNLTDSLLKGQARLKLLDALTLEEPALHGTGSPALHNWEAAPNETALLTWEFSLPEDTEALTYQVSAEAGRYTDGEENTLPVLPNSVLLTRSLPFTVKGKREYTFSLDTLLQTASPAARPYKFTLEYTSNPAWYAVQALPYLMEFPYECAEQVFSRLFANSLATHIIHSTPRIKQVFDRWKGAGSGELFSKLEQNQELKTALLTETPWVMEGRNESEQKKNLALLLDLNKMSNELHAATGKLRDMQLPDGSFPWFAGMRSDRFITQHILGGLGQLDHLHVFTGKTRPEALIRAALDYGDKQLAADYETLVKQEADLDEDHLSPLAAHYLYVRSFFPGTGVREENQKAVDFYLRQARDHWLQQPVYRQGMLALALHRRGDAETARKILRSLKDRAQRSEQGGMYWADNRPGYRWYQASTETQALLIEAFSEIGQDAEAVEAMQQWLLRQKQTRHWKSTKATAAACYALLMRGAGRLNAPDPAPGIRLGNRELTELKPALKAEAGTGYLKASWQAGELGPETDRVSIRNAGSSPGWGAAYWQYFEQPDQVKAASGAGLSIRKTLYKEENRDAGAILVPVREQADLKPGDLVKVRLEVRAGQEYEYLHLKDLRAAAFEPVDVLSRYHYRDGLGYYLVTRDASTNFFITYLPKGHYVLEYSLRVAHTGDFSGGFAGIQSMYAPEFSANSRGTRISIQAE